MTPRRPRCCPSTATPFRRDMQRRCGAIDSAPVWPRSTSCCRAKSRGGPRLADAPTLHMGGTRAQMALAEREVAAGRHAEWPMILAALPHLADPTASTLRAAGRCGRTHTCLRVHRRPDRDGHQRFSSASPRAFATSSLRRAAFPPHSWPITTPTYSAATSASAVTRCSRAGGADSAAEPVDHADSEGVPVLVGDAAGRRRARHGGLLRRPYGAAQGVRHQAAAEAVTVTADGKNCRGSCSAPPQTNWRQGVAADGFTPDLILAVARGGLFVAGALAYELTCENVAVINVGAVRHAAHQLAATSSPTASTRSHPRRRTRRAVRRGRARLRVGVKNVT